MVISAFKAPARAACSVLDEDVSFQQAVAEGHRLLSTVFSSAVGCATAKIPSPGGQGTLRGFLAMLQRPQPERNHVPHDIAGLGDKLSGSRHPAGPARSFQAQEPRLPLPPRACCSRPFPERRLQRVHAVPERVFRGPPAGCRSWLHYATAVITRAHISPAQNRKGKSRLFQRAFQTRRAGAVPALSRLNYSLFLFKVDDAGGVLIKAEDRDIREAAPRAF